MEKKTEKTYVVDQVKIPSVSVNKKCGIVRVSENVDNLYADYENCFKGGILKSFPLLHNGFTKDFSVKQVKPVIAIDFEKRCMVRILFFLKLHL